MQKKCNFAFRVIVVALLLASALATPQVTSILTGGQKTIFSSSSSDSLTSPSSGNAYPTDAYPEAGSNADVVPVYVDVLDSIPRADPSEWPGAQLGPDIRIVGAGSNADVVPAKFDFDFTSIIDPLCRLSCVDVNANALNADSDPNWAIGAYSTSVGNSIETTTWYNMPSSLTLGNGYSFATMVNCPISASGSVICNDTTYTYSGILIQAGDLYAPSYAAIPDVNVVFLAQSGDNYVVFYFVFLWTNISLGSGQVTETVRYENVGGVTAWWVIMNDYYLLGVSSSDFIINLNAPPTYLLISPSGVTDYSFTSIGTTSSMISLNGLYWRPSIAMEVNEPTSGAFFTSNPDVCVEADVETSAFYYYAKSNAAQYFNIGLDPAPGTAYGSGLTRESSSSDYYAEFGTSSGVNSWMSAHWSLANPTLTQTTTTNLPNLNTQCYLRMIKTGLGSGYLLPGSGWYLKGTQVQISATTIGCATFRSWTGSGSGSYTGYDNPATVTMNAYIQETGRIDNWCK